MQETTIQPALLRTMQIIWLALLTGVTIFGVVSLTILRKPPGDDRTVTSMAVVAGVVAVIAFFVVPLVVKKAVVAGMLRTAEQQRQAFSVADGYAAAYQVLMITRLALAEGAAFFALLAFQFEGTNLALAIALALWLLIAASFPAAGRVTAWVRNELETAELERTRNHR